eukprot:scaffold233066_cov74-Cyclotella_meneghiniana.AAC.2
MMLLMTSKLSLLLQLAVLSTAAAFSHLNTNNNRRDFLQSTFTSAITLTTCAPNIATAAYGDSSKIVMPNYIEFLIEKNKQCESCSID